MEKIPLTRKGFDKLDEELKKLKSQDRPSVIRAIAEAREHGDLSENAEYHAARESQSLIEGRIKDLEAIISRANVINPKNLSGAIKFGATVRLIDEAHIYRWPRWHRPRAAQSRLVCGDVKSCF